jgi:trypsin
MKIQFSLPKLLAMLTLSSVASASNLFQKDGANEGNQNIVGGTVATPGRYSHTVALWAGYQFCGGSLIAPDTVLTAAHCMDGSSFNVIINRHDLTTSAGQSIPRKTEMKHPSYNPDTMDNDFALVFLNTATTEDVAFLQLNQDDSFPDAAVGAISRAMGWGTTSSGGSASNVLREVDLPVITNEVCDQKYPQYPIFDSNICTFQPGKDSCQGDSGKCPISRMSNVHMSFDSFNCQLLSRIGGPLIMPGASANEDKLIGVVSWGIGCATSQYPGVYARVSDQIDWIKTNVCAKSNYPPSYLCNTGGSSSPTKKPTPKPTPSPATTTEEPTPTSSYMPTHWDSYFPTATNSTPWPTFVPTATNSTPWPTFVPTTTNSTPWPTFVPTLTPSYMPTNEPTLSENGPQDAAFDSSFGVPRCESAGSSCSSGTLLNGRNNIESGAEPNEPNTLDSCQDGPWGTYHSDESIDSIVVRSGDIDAPSDANMVEGGRATIEATVWAWNTVSRFHSIDTNTFVCISSSNENNDLSILK